MSMIAIPISKIVSGKHNVRVTGRRDGIDELAASIKSHGLLQPLVVRPIAGDKFEVLAGNRRLAALASLRKTGDLPKGHEVQCHVRDVTDDAAVDLSLAENEMRLPMHPVDRFEAFAALEQRGFGPEDIAASYGMKRKAVMQVLALGRLSPVVRAAWRKEEIDAETARAFAGEPDIETQEMVFSKLKRGHRLQAWSVRQELRPSEHRKAEFPDQVFERYIAEGGRTREDLFSEDVYLLDGPLLTRCEAQWKAAAAQGVRTLFEGQGWAWIALGDEMPGGWKWRNGSRLREHAEIDLTPDEQTRIDALRAEIDALPAGEIDRENALDADINLIEALAEARAYTPDERARSGVVLDINEDGTVDVTLGVLIKPMRDDDDDDHVAHEGDADDGDVEEPPQPTSEPEPEQDDGVGVSAALMTDLTTMQTVAIDHALSQSPDLALRVLLAALGSRPASSPLRIGVNGMRQLDRYDDTFAGVLLSSLQKPDAAVLSALAQVLGAAVDVRLFNHTGDRSPAQTLVDVLPATTYLAHMRSCFDAENTFKRLKKPQIVAAIEEMREAGRAADVAPLKDLEALKKPDLVAIATKTATACGWLPAMLRHPGYDITETPHGKAP